MNQANRHGWCKEYGLLSLAKFVLAGVFIGFVLTTILWKTDWYQVALVRTGMWLWANPIAIIGLAAGGLGAGIVGYGIRYFSNRKKWRM